MFWHSKQLILRITRKCKNFFNKRSSAESSVLINLKKRPQAPVDFLSRYERILARTVNWEPLEFKNKTVLELGCGPHLGFGPLALFLGAKCFIAVDPEAEAKGLASENLKNLYFRPLYRDLNAIYGSKQSFDEFLLNLQKRTYIFEDTKKVTNEFPKKIDIQLSNSCLEHIENLEQTISDLDKCLSENSRFLHCVDFGNHRRTENPFDDLYEIPAPEYRTKFGKNINLIPPSEMLNTFRKFPSMRPELVPYFYSSEGFKGSIHQDWKSKLKNSDYFLKVGILAGPIDN